MGIRFYKSVYRDLVARQFEIPWHVADFGIYDSKSAR